jgi:hypothetical protein
VAAKLMTVQGINWLDKEGGWPRRFSTNLIAKRLTPFVFE